jgi:hypothetical protein
VTSNTDLSLISPATRKTSKADSTGLQKHVNGTCPISQISVQGEPEDTVVQDVGIICGEAQNESGMIVRIPDIKTAQPEQLPQMGGTLETCSPEKETTSVDSSTTVDQNFVPSPTSESPVTEPGLVTVTPTDSEFLSFSSKKTDNMTTSPTYEPVHSLCHMVKASPSLTGPRFYSTASSLSMFPSFNPVVSSGLSLDSTTIKDTNISTDFKVQHYKYTPKSSIGNLTIVKSNPPQADSTRTRAQSNMLPPKPPSTVPAKRRQSVTIVLDNSCREGKRRRGSVVRSASVSEPAADGDLLITRRGVFNRRKTVTSSLKNAENSENREIGTPAPTPPSREGNGRINRSRTAAMIRHIVIECRGIVIVDKTLDPPLPLQRRDRGIAGHVTSSIPLSLDESSVFSLKGMTNPTPTPFFPPPLVELKQTPKQMQTPIPSSSPNHCLQSSPTRKTLSAPCSASVSTPVQKTHISRLAQVPINRTALAATYRPAHVPSTARRSDREPVNYARELKDAWVTPELSKDCVLGYAEEGVRADEPRVGVLRHVKSARPGWFVESEVLFAVRYLVG